MKRGALLLLTWLGGGFQEEAAAHSLAERVAALEARAGLVLRPPASEDAALVTEIEAALEALPPALRRPPGGPLELVTHPEPAPFGLGNASARRPEWSEDGRRFHLYAFVPGDERRAALRTARLSDGELERLWRRRAVVHAVMRRWDDARGWSGTARWRRLSGWRRPLERPLVFSEQALLTYDGAYSRARGRASAALDLATFAEEFFVPVESLREDALSRDERVACQEFSKARALGELLARDGLARLAPRAACPAFDAWARQEALAEVEVLLVSSTGRQPESLFGHLMLRPVWREDAEAVRGPGFDAVVQPVALTGGRARGPDYVLMGLAGGFSLAFLTTTLGDVAHEALELEQRTVRRFRLRLTAGERVRVLERVWELERRGYLPYFFATDNCASALLFLLNGALEEDRRVRTPGPLWVLPGATLDALARLEVAGPDGASRPLLEHVADDLESTGDRALRAHAARERALATVVARVGPSLAPRWTLLHRRLSSAVPGTRHAAWGRVPALVEATLAATPVAEAVHAYLAQSVRVERAEVDRMEARRLAVEYARLVAVRSVVPDHRGAERERQRVFEREDEVQRHLAALDRLALVEQVLATADKRAPTPEEDQVLARAREVEAVFQTATDVQGALQQGPLSQVEGLDFLRRDQADKVQAERTRAARGLETSGAARVAVGGGVEWLASGGPRPVLSLQTAALKEGLGESFLHGFRPSSELRLLDGVLRLVPGRGLPRVVDSRLTLLGYRTLLREPPWHRETLLDELGWGVEARMETRDKAHAQPYRATLQAEALLVVDDSPDFRHYAALGVGGRVAVRWGAWPTPGAGPRFSFAQRVALPGSSFNAVRLEAAWAPLFLLGMGPRYEAEASLQVEWLVGRWGPRALRLVPRAQLLWEGHVEPRVDMAIEWL
ncbi:DUF4105 domain-containing protein [Melittangium boletus]|uniref:lipoprotein N-acyltransferase Lnb domain-containing protein n=1 Tax=Melittangium boletus TaxID=83453 RepID=UPI003DA422D1